MELFCDPSIFDDNDSRNDKKKVEKIKRENDFENYVPEQREKNWFLAVLNETDEENKIEIDCLNHPDKYVQQETVKYLIIFNVIER